MKIFIVDDSDLNRKLLIETLKKAGINNDILETGDGKDALELLETEYKDICLIFLDWQLPGVDGLEILKRIARDPNTKSIPVIMLTSATSPESEEIARMLNPNLKDFIMKPMEPDNVLEIVSQYIN